MNRLFRPFSGRVSGCAQSQRGFTLIEMAIVLTIIGLIIGGILKGQELINNARMKTQVAQIDSIKSAVLTFQDRFGYLPGDDPNVGALGFAAGGGDGDGEIDNGTAGSGSTAGTTGAGFIADSGAANGTESVMAWADLVAVNLLAGYFIPSGTTLSGVTQGTTTTWLPGKFPSTYLWLANWQTSVTVGTTTVAQVNLAVRMQAESGGVGPTKGALKEADMIGLDTKYDDGLPYTGSIIVTAASTGLGCATSTAYATGESSPTALNCIPLFGIQ